MSGKPDDDELDETVMVDRAASDEDDADDDDHTVMVDRAANDEDDADDDDHTVMVDRAANDEDDDHTVMVDRAASDDDDDHTVMVNRKGATKPPKPAGTPAAKPTQKRGTGAAARRGLAAPPVLSGLAPEAVRAAGPGASETYAPRELPGPAPESVVPDEGAAATRVAAPAMPSVTRHRVRLARAAVYAFTGATVLAVVGLTAIVWSLVA